MLTLDETTYCGVSRKARFIDHEFGEWWTTPNNVLSGCSHPKRACNQIAQSVRAFNQRALSVQLEKLRPLVEFIQDQYGTQGKSYEQVRDACAYRVDVHLTTKAIRMFIHLIGIQRSVKNNRFQQKRFCTSCQTEFVARSGKQRLCSMCAAPNTLARKLGMSNNACVQALESQNNSCAICQRSFTTMLSRQVHTDHCHSKNKFRGFLCVNCNHGLGCFFDNPSFLRQAADYLERQS